jgi:hypothetical protein
VLLVGRKRLSTNTIAISPLCTHSMISDISTDLPGQ